MKRCILVLVLLLLFARVAAAQAVDITNQGNEVTLVSGTAFGGTANLIGGGWLTRTQISGGSTQAFSIISGVGDLCTMTTECTYLPMARLLNDGEQIQFSCLNALATPLTATFEVIDNNGGRDMGLLTCLPAGGGLIAVTPSSVEAGTINVGQASAPVTITVTNISSGVLDIRTSDAEQFPDQWDITGCDPMCPLGAGLSTEIRVVFRPTAPGAANTRFAITAFASPGQQEITLPLTGTGASSAQLFEVIEPPAPYDLIFADVPVMTNASLPLTLKLTSPSAELVTFTSSDPRITISPTSATMSPGMMTFQVNCLDSAPALIDATILINTTVPRNTDTVFVSCEVTDEDPGEPSASLVPSAIDLGTRCLDAAGMASAPLVLTNDGPIDVVVQAPSVPAPFAVTVEPAVTFPYTLAPGASLSAKVLVPTATGGMLTADVTWTVDDVRTFTVPVALTVIDEGTAISPRMIDFGPFSLDATAAAQTISLQQCSAATSTIELLALVNTQGAASVWLVTPAPGPLALDAEGRATVEVQFAPRAPGPYRAELPFLVDGVRESVNLAGVGRGESFERTSFYACTCAGGGSLAGGWPLLLALVPLRRRRRVRAAPVRSATSPR